MRDYVYNIPVPPNTYEQSPLVTVVPLLGRRLRMCSIVFPDGCLMAVGIRVKSYGGLIIPTNAGWVIGNNERLDFYPNINLPGPGYQVELEICNYAMDFPHTINIRLEVDY